MKLELQRQVRSQAGAWERGATGEVLWQLERTVLVELINNNLYLKD